MKSELSFPSFCIDSFWSILLFDGILVESNGFDSRWMKMWLLLYFLVGEILCGKADACNFPYILMKENRMSHKYLWLASKSRVDSLIPFGYVLIITCTKINGKLKTLQSHCDHLINCIGHKPHEWRDQCNQYHLSIVRWDVFFFCS